MWGRPTGLLSASDDFTAGQSVHCHTTLRRHAIQAASKTLRDLRIAEVVKQDMAIENGKVVAYRTRMLLSFKYQA